MAEFACAQLPGVERSNHCYSKLAEISFQISSSGRHGEFVLSILDLRSVMSKPVEELRERAALKGVFYWHARSASYSAKSRYAIRTDLLPSRTSFSTLSFYVFCLMFRLAERDRCHEVMSGSNTVHSLERGLAILRIVAGSGPAGFRLTDIVELAGMHKASVARILDTLVNGQAIRKGADKRYYVDDAFRAVFGMPKSTIMIRDAVRPAISRVVEDLGDAAFLSVRSGFDSLCVERHVGWYAMQALSLNVGSRRPLGIGAGAMSLLAHLDEDEQEAIFADLPRRLSAFPHITVDEVRREAAATRVKDYAHLPNFVVPGMTGMGVAIRDRDGIVVGAISVAAVGERLNGQRHEHALRTLREARQVAEERLASGSSEIHSFAERIAS
ncbi:IclR family transcriptional regulator [Mesorhizobium sp. YIM 152430]|uniref:IclR family transcriptional regulator n=1 Tax=Mesorhizobium sp. YIM 152430 TaxID=3031761 RepID=UPI0023DA4AA6|nr:IclR family transcriptional regulator [Mesorhizobium sp. YIM 152430]MDF1600913.1 IclR family transcriptional regulator [Mesorhizobium sp. YIM 152430]